MQATVKDSKVFGEFNVTEDTEVLYFQLERHPDESFERMRHIVNMIPFNKDKFALSTALQGTNLMSAQSYTEALIKVSDIIHEIGFTPKIIAFDPIYAFVPDDLSTAIACNSITRFFRILQLTFNCTILATSHTNRGVRDKDTGKRGSKDMYGNRFLSAFFTGSYHVEAKPDGAGSIWTRDKNSQSNLEKKFELMYDGASYTSTYLSDNKFSKKDRLENFLKACKNQDKEFSFDDMMANSGLSCSPLRGYLTGYLKESVKESSKGKYGKILYKYIGQ